MINIKMLFSEYNFFKLNFIDPASPLMYGIIELHDHIFYFLNMILFFVLFLIWSTLKLFTYNKSSTLNRYLLSQATSSKFEWLRINSGTTIEIIWTVVPSLILVFIAIPSFTLLYATDEIIDPSLTVQVIAHQWYRSYEYNDLIALTTNLTLNLDLAAKVENFLMTIALSLGYNLLNESECLEFVWFLSKNNQTNFFGLGGSVWELYARSSVDTLHLKALYLENFKTLKFYYPELDNNSFSKFVEWGLTVGIWFKSTKYVGNIEFDSYLKQESDLQLGEFRLYETDFPLVLPKSTHIRFMITSDDVIHSWSVPALGIKVDAVPGRINHAHTYIKRSGVFYGQCSEPCGVNHAFMPIQILAFEPNLYYDYIRLVLMNR